jgi:hypothetical protein
MAGHRRRYDPNWFKHEKPRPKYFNSDDEQLRADVLRIISVLPEDSPARVAQAEGASCMDVMRLVPPELLDALKAAESASRDRVWAGSMHLHFDPHRK